MDRYICESTQQVWDFPKETDLETLEGIPKDLRYIGISVNPVNESSLQVSLKRDADMLLGDTYELDGVPYQVSLTKDDGDGMIQVKIGFELGVQNTIVHFSNGTKVPVNSSNFPKFALWFVNARNKFFI